MEKNTKIVCKVRYIICYACLAFPIVCENILSTCFGDRVSKFLCALCCCAIFLLIIQKRIIHISLFELVLVVMILLKCIIMSFVPEGVVIGVNNNMITPYGLIAYFVLFMFTSNSFDNKEKMFYVFSGIFWALTIGIFMNIILNGNLTLANNISVFKEAVTTGYTNSRDWLFGHRNMIFIHHLMWILSGFIKYKIKGDSGNKCFAFQIIVTFLVSVLSWNSTMMISTFLLLILHICNNSVFGKFVCKNFVLIYVFLEISIVFFNIQKLFSFVIVNILHRSLSFTGRVTIWKYYINQFMTGSLINKLFGNFGVTEVPVNAHNMFLGLLAFTGIIGLAIYIILLLMSQRRLKRCCEYEVARFISSVILTYLINSITMEFYIQPLFAVFLGYNVEKIIVVALNKGGKICEKSEHYCSSL